MTSPGRAHVDPEFWRGKRVLLTGHTGFKGSWLSFWLHEMGARVRGLALPPDTDPSLFHALGIDTLVDHRIGDVRDRAIVEAAVRESEPEIVLHLAAQALVRRSYQTPIETYATNVMGTAHVLEAARTVPSVRAIVVVTTDKCYENREWVWGYREADPLGGHDPYSSSKAVRGARVGRVPFVLLLTPWGRAARDGARRQRDRRRRLVPRPAHPGRRARLPRGRVLGDSLAALHATLAARARAARGLPRPRAGASRRPAGADAAWNFGPEERDALPVSDLMKMLVGAWGQGASWKIGAAPNDLHEAGNLKLDTSKGARGARVHPRWTLETAIHHTVAWYRAFYESSGADALRALSAAQISRVWERIVSRTIDSTASPRRTSPFLTWRRRPTPRRSGRSSFDRRPAGSISTSAISGATAT